MESDEYMKECLKFSYVIFSKIYELVLNVEDENYLNLVIPSVYYFLVFKNQSNYSFANFPPLNLIMNKLYQICSERLYKKFDIDPSVL